MTDSAYQLLMLCARVDGDAAQQQQLRQMARDANWPEVINLAEEQGVAPLLYHHLRMANIDLPDDVKLTLQGLFVRHRTANRVRVRVLRDILSASQQNSIPVLVLKGAALAHMIYPEPALRPMSDLDLFVAEADLVGMQQVLIDLGFRVLSSTRPITHRHLAAATIEIESVAVRVEVHQHLYSNYFDNAAAYLRARWFKSAPPPKTKLSDLTESSVAFDLMDISALTLGRVDMLQHLCRHLVSHVNAWDSGRLIWFADIASFVTRFTAEIDWAGVRRQQPATIDTLSLVHVMSPLPDDVIRRTGIRIDRVPRGIGEGYRGWPHARSASWRSIGCRQVLHDTLQPAEWWLRLHYNVGMNRSIFWYRWIRQPVYLMGHLIRTALERLGWPKSIDLAGQ